jgi:zinc transporter ZupT
MGADRHCDDPVDGACYMSATASAAVQGLGPPVLLLAGLAGLAIPWAMHRSGRVPPHGRAGASLRAVGAGIVLGIALLHCLPEAAEALGCTGWGGDYPWAFLIAAAAAAAAALLEGALVDAFGASLHCGGQPPLPPPAGKQAGGGAAPATAPARLPGRPDSAHAPDVATAEAGVGGASAAAAHYHHPFTTATLRAHSHSGGPEAPPPSFHAAAIAVLEVGIGLHSLVVGFALGSARTGCAALPLLVAFAVHQLLEGAAVGACIADSALARPAVLAAGAVMALTAPAGAVIGLATRRAQQGAAGLAVVGVADALAAGLLLHVGLADLLASGAGVGLRGCGSPPTKGRRVAAHVLFSASLVVGLALAAVLAVWG